MDTSNLQQRGFAVISSPDGSHQMRLSRPLPDGRIFATCSFALAGHWDFVDSIDTLGYVRVIQGATYDADFSSMQMNCLLEPGECMERLMEDLPKVMEEWL